MRTWKSVAASLGCIVAWLFSVPAISMGQQVAIGAYPVPTHHESFPSGTTAGLDGALWFTESNIGQIGRITAAGAITQYVAGASTIVSPGVITTGPDDALWFTEGLNNAIGRITTAGAVSHYSGLTSGGYGITSGPHGALWFTQETADKIGRITTAGAITGYAMPTANSSPFGICAGPDGALWFVEYQGNKIGRITTSGAITAPPRIRAAHSPIRQGSRSNHTARVCLWARAGPVVSSQPRVSRSRPG